MILIKLAQIAKHRNETTFRPYLMAKDLFEDIGVRFVAEGKCDLTWVAQATYNDRKDFYTYEHCVSRGLYLMEKEVQGDYVMFDGQDSASLIGSFDVFKNSKAKLLLKNSLYSTFEDYLTPWKMGRMYWGIGEIPTEPDQKYDSGFGYKLEESDKEKFSQIKLTGCNWLSTFKPRWYDYGKLEKDIDVFAMFSYPGRDNWEFGALTSTDYDAHRKKCTDALNTLPNSIKVAKLEDGKKVPIEEYYNLMSRAKIVIAPFGYGEMAPRDIEAAQFGAILIKPYMDHIDTIPNAYISEKEITYEFPTYVGCEWDFNDLSEKIEILLSDFTRLQSKYCSSMKLHYTTQYNPENLVMQTYNWLTKLEGFETD